MIKDAEIAMVHAASYALDFKDANADVEQIIKQFSTDFKSEIKPEAKVYSIAAINAVMKLKRAKENRALSNKQLTQAFVKMIPELSRQISEDNDY